MFMKKYQEQLPGFKFVLNEILTKQVFNADNLRLTAMLTLDFKDYISCAGKAQTQFFSDRMARS